MFGRVELRGLREKVGVFAAGFDPALVSPAQANAMVDDAAAIEKMAATVKALLAARVAETIETEDPFLAAVVTRGKDVVNVAHLGRRPSAHQLSALDWLAPTCRREGCDATVGLENDHRHDWAATRITLLEWIDRLCPHDHDLKTYEGWALVEGTGKRPLVPPEDPRHPRHAGATRPPPAKEPTRSTDRSPPPAPGSDDDLAAAS